ncbi:MAG: c-type cytochrome biogenesis protein CcsB [Candidatus Cloacimonadota bacterium]|nr:MAG: c-type cytochrome biogenesis protein CcsB [Candidatus Cloacimonadota bacterium]
MNLLNIELNLFLTVILIYCLSFLFYIVYLVFPRALLKGKVATYILLFGAFLHTILIILRTIETKHAPFQTLYESLSWFSYSAVFAYLFIEWRRKVRLPGCIVSAIAIAACCYAYFALSPEPKPLPPALQSGWFVWHVVLAFSSYAIFVVAFAVEIIWLLLGKRGKKYDLEKKQKKYFHRMSYNLILFAFPLLTFGIISGAAWAQEAWGGYWVWDPKETWSLITWFVYTLYLHAVAIPRWGRMKASALNILGFVCMIFTFLGVNWLTRLLNIPSLHAY